MRGTRGGRTGDGVNFYAHIDDRPLPALVKKETSRPQPSSKPSKPDDKTSRPQSSAKPSKLPIPPKASADPPRLAETKHQHRSSSRRRQRHKSRCSFDDFAVASSMSGDSGRLTTPAPSVARSRSRSRPREHHRSSITSQATNHVITRRV